MIIQHPWISATSLYINHKTTFSAFAGWDRCGRRWSDQLWRVLHHDVHKVLRGHKGLQGKVGSGEASRSAKQSLFHLNTLQCPGYVLHSMNIFIYTQSESKLPTNITVRRRRRGGFFLKKIVEAVNLAVHLTFLSCWDKCWSSEEGRGGANKVVVCFTRPLSKMRWEADFKSLHLSSLWRIIRVTDSWLLTAVHH